MAPGDRIAIHSTVYIYSHLIKVVFPSILSIYHVYVFVHSMFACLFVHFVSLTFCLSVCMYVCMPVCISIYLAIYIYIYIYIYRCLYGCISVCLYICYLHVHLVHTRRFDSSVFLFT